CQPCSGTSVVFLSVTRLVSARASRGQDHIGDDNQRVAACALGKWSMQYSSPSRETRNSRSGSLNSVLPQTLHLCSGSVSLRESSSYLCRRVVTSRRCFAFEKNSGPKKIR